MQMMIRPFQSEANSKAEQVSKEEEVEIYNEHNAVLNVLFSRMTMYTLCIAFLICGSPCLMMVDMRKVLY